jgi:solute carrier family 25 protein 39/40
MVGIYMPLYDSLLDSWSQRLGSLAPVVSGTAARTVACFCVAPFELIRTRLQASAAAGVSMRSTLSSLVTEHQQHASQPPAAQQQLQQRTAQQLGATAAAAGQAQAQGQLQLQQAQAQQIKPATVLRAVPRMWTGFSATLVRDVPFSALYWALVEPLRQAMLPVNSHWPPLQRLDDFVHKRPHHHQQQQQKQQRPGSTGSGSGSGDASSALLPPSQQRLMHHSQLEILIANMVSGFVAGGLAAGATTPFDVVKTRMQIATPSQQQQQGALGSSSSSSGRGGGRGIRVFNILRDVYAREGVEGMFSGLKPRAARAAPACAIVISVYELLKSYLTLA